MKRCTYCGKEYSDDAILCSIDGMALAGRGGESPISEEPISLESIARPETSGIVLTNRQLRIIELLLVCAVAFGGSMLGSIYSLLGGTLPSVDAANWIVGIFREISALSLLWYVLLRRSKSFSDLGFGFKWTDIGWSIVLWLAGHLAFIGVYALSAYCGLASDSRHAATGRVGQYFYGAGVPAVALVFACINPFLEEMIARAYVMTEVRQLTGSVWAAVVVSTVLQAGYHFYQGVPLALAVGAMFFLWSLFFAKTNRITPVILAHLYTDVFSAMWYMLHHR